MAFANPGTALLFENAWFRVWEIVLEPGERLDVHRHDLPYCFVVIEPGTMRGTSASGRVVDSEQKPGDVVFREPGEVHDLVNVGTTRYVNRVIEWKNPAG